MKQDLLIIISLLVLTSCADKYAAHKSEYTRTTTRTLPDYSDLYYWASHPNKWDPADSIPKPLMNEKRDSLADVFFLHPTMYTSKRKFKEWNVEIDDAYHNAKTDYSSIMYQASVFNQHAWIFAPRFREAHIKTFFLNDSAMIQKNLELAYRDIKTAFEYYLKNWNHNRPIIIASHSQGSVHAQRLLKEFFEDKPLGNQLVAAYVLGWPVPKQYFSSLKMCVDSTDINCLCSWRTYRKGFTPKHMREQTSNSFVTNPLNWKADETYAGKNENKGSVLLKFNKVYKKTTDAQIHNGLLWVKKPKFPWSFMYATRNYHIADINLFYINIRENVGQRINAYYKKYPAN
jgi:Protein of unknown function (DUF3089)